MAIHTHRHPTGSNTTAKKSGGEASKVAVYNPDIDISIAYGLESEHDALGAIWWNPLLASETDGAMLSPATILDVSIR